MADGREVAHDVTEPEIDERDRPGPHLKANALGVAALLFFVLSAQAPLTGIAGAGPIAIALGNGIGAPGAYLVAGAIVGLFAVGYLAMSRHVVNAGAFYAYIGQGLGRPVGTGAAQIALLAYTAIQAAMYGLYGSIVSGIVASAGLDLPWWVWALVTMAIVQYLGVVGIDIGAKVLAVLVVAETAILVAFDLAVLLRPRGGRLRHAGDPRRPEGLAVRNPPSATTAMAASRSSARRRSSAEPRAAPARADPARDLPAQCPHRAGRSRPPRRRAARRSRLRSSGRVDVRDLRRERPGTSPRSARTPP